MAAEYKVIIRNASGVAIGELSDYEILRVIKQVNAAGAIEFVVPAGHPKLSLLSHRCQVDVQRKNASVGLDWYTVHTGLYLKEGGVQRQQEYVTVTCPGIMWLLGTRHVAYYAGTANRSMYTSLAAETIGKRIVQYNCTSSGTTGDGRLRNAAFADFTITIQADGGGGNVIASRGVAFENVLKAIGELAEVAGGDFDLVRTGATTYQFRWYAGQRGTDRSSGANTLLFAWERGNLAEIRYGLNRIDEKTVALVGGKGEQDDRNVVIRTGADYSATNDIETFVYASNKPDSELASAGDAALRRARASAAVEFAVLQRSNCYYGLHYEVGDRALFRWRGLNSALKIVGAAMAHDRRSGGASEKVSIEVEDV